MGLKVQLLFLIVLLCGTAYARRHYYAITEEGVVVGSPSPSGTHKMWNSIPYAAPPVGELRWRAPQRAALRQALLNVTAFPPLCPQRITSLTGNAIDGQEDCLYLSVFAPGGHKLYDRPLPVQIYIHGGSFVTGGASFYNGEILSGAQVVFVAIQYRLGGLGFLNHPALLADPKHAEGSGFYGILDQRFAMKWVQRNIRHFGGDPTKVTISGESAGAASVQAHLAFPSTEGLFRAAILQSEYNGIGTNASGITSGLKLANTAGCPATGVSNANQLACLLGTPILNISSATPSVGTVLKDTPINILRAGGGVRVPIFIGSNLNESAFLGSCATKPVSTLTQYNTYLSSSFPATTAAVGAAFNASYYPNPLAAYIDISTHRTFTCAAKNLSDVFSKDGAPVYMYQLTSAPAFLQTTDSAMKYGGTNDTACFGVSHSFDLSYLFPTYWAQYSIVDSLNSQEQVLRENMRHAWTQFVRFSVPRMPVSDGADAWPRYYKVNGTYVTLNDSGFNVQTYFSQEQCAALGL